MTLGALATEFKVALLEMYGEMEAHSLFLLAIEHYLKLDRGAYQLKKTEEVSAHEVNELKQVLKALLAGKPIQYIMGEAHFYGLKFKVNPAVLIPRPETEELVAWILEEASGIQLKTPSTTLTVLDIGTGSGCIAISLKKNLPSSKMYAIDISLASISTAKENASLNNVEVDFIQQDILQAPKPQGSTSFSIIVSNPPYIKMDEKQAMHPNVLDHEPHQALFVSNENPLIFYEAIADFAMVQLSNEGLLFFEINEYLGKETIDLLKDKGFINIQLKKDMQGKERMICAVKQSKI
jgi:release factor glutamine methyltransferase